MNTAEIDDIVKALIEELKVKLESELESVLALKKSRSDMSIMNSQINKLMDATSTSEDSSMSSSTTSSDDDDEIVSSKKKKAPTAAAVRKPVLVSSSDTDDDSDNDNRICRKRAPPKYVKTKNEITIDEMPPIEVIDICLDENVKLVPVGRVISKVDKLVIIQSQLNADSTVTPLDEETILFDSKRKSVGKIFEIFGPVAAPFYSLRFNSLNEIETRQLELATDALVYCAPARTDLTKYIFNVDEMRREKGSDASWQHDNEPPVDYLDYSDDEAERAAKRSARKKNASSLLNGDNDEDDPSSSEDESGQQATAHKRGPPNNINNNNNKKKQHFQQPRGQNVPNKTFQPYGPKQYNYNQQMNSNFAANKWIPPKQGPQQQFMNMNFGQPYQYGYQCSNFISMNQSMPPALMQIGPGFIGGGFIPQPQFQFFHANTSPATFQNCQSIPNIMMQQHPAPAAAAPPPPPPPPPSQPPSNNQTNNIVDRRFIKDQSYKKKFF